MAALAVVGVVPVALLVGENPPSSAGSVVTVVGILDGDTVIVAGDEALDVHRVRVLGVDAPEMGRDGAPADCWALQAREQLMREVPVGSRAVLVPDSTRRSVDRYGRLLRYLQVDDRDVGADLLEAGGARTYWPTGDGKRASRYVQTALRAERAGRGLWGAC
ncbi:thermonuclease family protein [Phycicoccus sp. KQZ13P-1]|uniref:thermonuclease family protein n=1 Tax=Phycicoccus mangrovi TaxID=2840470 RepID=UPI001C001BF4|nr:thermonuclease family protein [Phycicoccus mangrovi]MBT9257759.1 thermonuclease family protein [Phycicoccus mangrovi]